MLRSLTLEGVGPAKKLSVEFGDRLNLITGDNGLGKSFLLDIAWWALTHTWAYPEVPIRPRVDAQTSRFTSNRSEHSELEDSATFDFSNQVWRVGEGEYGFLDLVVFARVDGGFTVWDPARNLKSFGQGPYLFDPREVWEGLEEAGKWRCNGLYRDWASWQREDNESFRRLERVIERLSPPGERLQLGPLQRISPSDAQDYPTIQMPTGLAVPVIHASAAIRRILALAYLIVWSWQEHLLAAKFRQMPTARNMVFLIDEIEAHLHPSWQRRILPSLLTVSDDMQTQIIATTHSPLVCLSVESQFNPETDRLLDMDLDPENGVKLESVPFRKLGTSENWLVSRNFDMHSTRSESAEAILEQAGKLVEQDNATKADFDVIQQKLAAELPDTDSFWVIWRRLGEKRGWIE